MTLPKISVIMSVYNGMPFLDESIKSILDQSFSDFEFIIVDDCSKDNSLEILRKYEMLDPRVKILVNEVNKGLVWSLNTAIKNSRSPIIARMDADDISYSTRLEEQYEIIKNNDRVGLISTLKEDIDENGKILVRDNPDFYCFNSETIRQKLLMEGNLLNHPTVMFRKKHFEEVGGYRIEFEGAEDYDLWLRLSNVCEAYILAKILLKYRRLSSSVTMTKAAIAELCAQVARKCAGLICEGHSECEEIEKWKLKRKEITEELAVKELKWVVLMRIGMNMLDINNKKSARWYLAQALKRQGGINKRVLLRLMSLYFPSNLFHFVRKVWRNIKESENYSFK